MIPRALLVFLVLGWSAHGSENYLCSRLKAIIAEEKMPSMAAGLVLPAYGYPAHAPLPWDTFTCSVGVEKWGSATPVTANHLFPLGSIGKVFSALIIARVIAQEALKPKPRITWNMRLDTFYPELFKKPTTNACYASRTVADLTAHTAGFPAQPATEPPEQWTPIEPDPVKRRQMYVEAAVKDPPAVRCFFTNGPPLAQVAFFYGGAVIIGVHMAETILGRSWEDLMLHAGTTTAGPGISVGDFSKAVSPVAWNHVYDSAGNPVPQQPISGTQWTNNPAGGVYVTAHKMADALKEWLNGSQKLANAWLPQAEWATLTQRLHPDSYTRLGWAIIGVDSYNWNKVAHWVPKDPVLWKNGSFNGNLAEAYLVPARDTALFFMIQGDKTPANNTKLKALGELAALRLHAGDAAEMTWQQASESKTSKVSAMVAEPGVVPHPASAIVDGKLTTKLNASQPTATLTVIYAEPKGLDQIVVVEDEGPRIQQYKLSYQNAEGKWVSVPTSNQPIFPHRFFAVPPPAGVALPNKPLPAAVAKKIQLEILAASAPPRIVEIAAGQLGREAKASWWADLAPASLQQ